MADEIGKSIARFARERGGSMIITADWTPEQIAEFKRAWHGALNGERGTVYAETHIVCRCGHEWRDHDYFSPDYLHPAPCNVTVRDYGGLADDQRCPCVGPSLDLYALVLAIRMESMWLLTGGHRESIALNARTISRAQFGENFQRLDCEPHLMKDFQR